MIVERIYEIDGMSRPAALERELRLPETLGFLSYGEMAEFAENLKQRLVNLRLYTKTAVTLRERTPRAAEGPRLYEMVIALKDSWTFVPLVYPKYDTNTNLTLEAKVLYSNVLGTLMDFQLDGFVEVSPEDEIEGLSTGQWEVDAALGNINWGGRTYRVQWIQKFDRVVKKNLSATVEDYTFHESLLRVDTAFDWGENLSYTVAPGFVMRYGYRDRRPAGSGELEEEPLLAGVLQTLVYDGRNWRGNLQEGFYAEGGLLLNCDLSGGRELKGSVYTDARYYGIFGEFLGFNLRNRMIKSFRQELPDLGVHMRGVPDRNLYGHGAFFLNSGLPLRVLDWDGVAELQLEPFADMGLTLREAGFAADQDFHLSSGVSLLFFFDKVTSVQVRGSFGWDLSAPSSQEDRFEFLLSTSLFY